jgi:hypothetical protein
MRFEVLTAVKIRMLKMAVFCVVAPCSLVEIYRRFRGTCCLHHQGLSHNGGDSKRPWNVCKFPPDCCTVQHSRRQPSSYSSRTEPEISSHFLFIIICTSVCLHKTQSHDFCQDACVCSAGITRLPVLEGEISHIEIPRLATNLGITIVGGADTALVSSTMTSSHSVHVGSRDRTGVVVCTSHCVEDLIRCIANIFLLSSSTRMRIY